MKKIKKREIIETQENRIVDLLEEQKRIRIWWFFIGLLIAAAGWLIIVNLSKYCENTFLSDAERCYENFFEDGDDGMQHLFHLKKYLAVNRVKFDYIFVSDNNCATNITIYAKRDRRRVIIRSRVNWHDMVQSDESLVADERNTGRAAIEVFSDDNNYLHSISWTLNYDWDLSDDEFIQDLDTGMILPHKLLKDLDSVLANNKLADYRSGPFEDIDNPDLVIEVNGDEVEKVVHD